MHKFPFCVLAVLFLADVSNQAVPYGHDSSTAAHIRQKRSSVHHLFCPTGEKNLRVTYSDISNHHVMREFDNFCQCDSDRSKNWRTDDQGYFCGSISNTFSKTVGRFLQNNNKVGDACIDPRHVLRNWKAQGSLWQRVSPQLHAAVPRQMPLLLWLQLHGYRCMVSCQV